MYTLYVYTLWQIQPAALPDTELPSAVFNFWNLLKMKRLAVL